MNSVECWQKIAADAELSLNDALTSRAKAKSSYIVSFSCIWRVQIQNIDMVMCCRFLYVTLSLKEINVTALEDLSSSTRTPCLGSTDGSAVAIIHSNFIVSLRNPISFPLSVYEIILSLCFGVFYFAKLVSTCYVALRSNQDLKAKKRL